MSSPQRTIQTPKTDLSAALEKIGLRATAQSLDDLVTRATKGQWTPRVLVEHICQIETSDKSDRSLQRRLKRSRIGRFKPVADFDWAWPTKIDRPLIERAFTLDFIRRGHNLILIGNNGLGKTLFAKALADAAVNAGFSVLFRSASELLDDLAVDSPLLRRRKIAKYARAHLLCLDELGYLSYDEHAADILYTVLNPRYEASRSTLITTNLVFKDWGSAFPNAACLRTLIDRLTHHADVSVIEGESYRTRESEMEAAARRSPARKAARP